MPKAKARMDGVKLTHEELAKMLEPIARMPDGRYRVLASRMLAGKPKGSFPHIGIRHDVQASDAARIQRALHRGHYVLRTLNQLAVSAETLRRAWHLCKPACRVGAFDKRNPEKARERHRRAHRARSPADQ